MNDLSATFRECYGCKAQFIYNDGPTDRYGVCSPECWATFNAVLAKEQEWAGYPFIHRLLVDTYAVQHPPHLEIQKKLEINQRLINASIQSVFIHLIALYLAFEKKIQLQDISKHMAHILKTEVKFELLELKAPSKLGHLTIADIHKASTFEEYEKLIYQWAESTWKAWINYHNTVKQLYEKYGLSK